MRSRCADTTASDVSAPDRMSPATSLADEVSHRDRGEGL
jgi:hypothetical protein